MRHPLRPARRGHPSRFAGLALLLILAGCDSVSDGPDNRVATDNCLIDTANFADGGVPKDGIPALTNPEFVSPADATYLRDDSRVIGIVRDGQPIAIPHNILWWHEIVNVDFQEGRQAITYCPLTGSSMAFDRDAVGGGEFGVSGLLFQNNLTMYDRTNDESLWPQMNREAGCGPRAGTALTMLPVIEMTWAGWRDLYPDTRVLSAATGFTRNYTPAGYPYGDYEDVDNAQLIQRMPIDERRPPKERVLGIPAADGGVAFPFGALDDGQAYRVVNDTLDGAPIVVLWDRARQSAMAYRAPAGSDLPALEVRDDAIRDRATDSVWRVDGLAASGPLAGTRLTPVPEAYVAFWFAWARFHPETRLWERL